MKKLKNLVSKFDRAFYKNCKDNWDDELFRKRIIAELMEDWVILDIGAGVGVVLQMNFKPFVKKVYGVDPDPRISINPYLDESYIGLGDNMDFFENDKFDFIFCDNVFEHISNPISFLKEVNRVLKKGGIFMAKTPNKFHYMPMIARSTPTGFHKFYNKLRGRDVEDTFPTLYKLNSFKDQKKLATETNFQVLETKSFERRPEYLRITWMTYLLGIAYERFVNKLNLNFMKLIIISKWKKI